MDGSNLIINLFIAVGIIGIIVYLKLINNRPQERSESDKIILDILNSDEYKVKGKYD
jgi:hypothetical protein